MKALHQLAAPTAVREDNDVHNEEGPVNIFCPAGHFNALRMWVWERPPSWKGAFKLIRCSTCQATRLRQSWRTCSEVQLLMIMIEHKNSLFERQKMHYMRFKKAKINSSNYLIKSRRIILVHE